MIRIIDFHTHAFPDAVAARAVPNLEKSGNVQARSDGTVTGLLGSMDRAGIGKSVICSIATRVEQFQAILNWSTTIRSEQIIPLPSIHPDDPDLAEHIMKIREAGFVGIKLHPYYQDFFLAEDRLTQLYASVIEHDLFVVVHSGFDIAYPRIRRTDPEQVVRLLQKFPDLKLITTHLGGWEDWDEVRRLLIGREIYMELSFALNFLSPKQAREMITAHPPDYILFGTDSPWADQKEYLQQLRNLELEKSLLEKILWKNGEALL